MNGIFASAMLNVLAVSAAEPLADAASLVIHEWGAFTSFQDSRGLTISVINVDDEPVPKFVHRLGDVALSGTYDRPSGDTQQQYTLPYVPGARFGEKKPVFILISKRTFSAAEAFAYALQALSSSIWLEIRHTSLSSRNGAFVPFVQPTPQSDSWRHDRGRIVS